MGFGGALLGLAGHHNTSPPSPHLGQKASHVGSPLPLQTQTPPKNAPNHPERTAHGCLCASEWRVPGAGKDGYRNGCASPDREGARNCRVDAATCPPGAAAALADGYDACPDRPERWAAPAVIRMRTHNNCSCIGEWYYLYPGGGRDGGGDGAPANRTVFGCANPDGDPAGAWCPVDPASCGRFAGYVAPSADAAPWAFDYCAAPRPAPLLKRGDGCRPGLIPEFGQCGETERGAWLPLLLLYVAASVLLLCRGRRSGEMRMLLLLPFLISLRTC